MLGIVSAVLAVNELTAVQSLNPSTVAPGETFTKTVQITANQKIFGVLLANNLPDGWTMTPVSITGGGVFRTSANEVLWLSVPAASTVTATFNITVPSNATYGNYNLTSTVRISSGITPVITIGQNTETVSAASVPGDANGDGCVDFVDFSILAGSWQKSNGDEGFDSRADFNNDGIVDFTDFTILAVHWQEGCST